MAQEIVIDCSTGEVREQGDTFLATKPVSAPVAATNPNQPLIDAITTAKDFASLKANMLAALGAK